MSEKKSLFDYSSIQKVTENFSLGELLNFIKTKNLVEWLESNLYFEESKKIREALENNLPETELKLLLCKIFEMNLNSLSSDEVEEISATVGKNQRRKLFFEQRDERKAAFVETQGELVRALKDGAEVLFLYSGEFKIPIDCHNKTYIGRNNAVVDITFDDNIDFDERNIIFEDLQIYLAHPITLKFDKSKNVKILNGFKKTLGVRPTLKEIFEIMRGRNPFESAENFRRSVENIRGAVVGKVLLEEKNYNYDENKFSFHPQWEFEYISVLKNFIKDRNFFINISPENAEQLYNNERKLQIFADFTYIDGELTILNLYFETVKLGRIAIENILRRLKNKISSGSGFGLGYGLHIIAAYKNGEGLS